MSETTNGEGTAFGCVDCSDPVTQYCKGVNGDIRCGSCAVKAYKKTNGYLVDKYRIFGRGKVFGSIVV